MPDQTGQVGKWYIAPSNKKVYQELRNTQSKNTKVSTWSLHADTEHRTAAGLYPCKTECETEENQQPYYYFIAGRSNKRKKLNTNLSFS